MSKENNLKDYLADLYQGIASKKPNASKNPQNFRAEIESIQGGGGVCHNPHVYHLNDPDLLPDAVDGSLAVVEDNNLKGVWELNEELTTFDTEEPSSVFVDFYCLEQPDRQWSSIYCSNTYPYFEYSDGEIDLNVYDDGWCICNDIGNLPDHYLGRTICLTKDPTDEIFRNWLPLNGKRLSGSPYTLYSRVNGSWVPEGDQDFAVITDCTGDHVNVVTKLPTEHIDSNALYLFNGDYYRYENKAWKKYSSGGGSSECSGDHVIPVTELPTENVDENALYKMGESYYKYAKALKDLLVGVGGSAISYAEALAQEGATLELFYVDNYENVTDPRLIFGEDGTTMSLYYDASRDDIFCYMEEQWGSLGTLMDAPYGGAITDVSQATTDGCYYALVENGWKPLGSAEYKGEVVIE